VVKELKLGHIDTVCGICPECKEDTILIAIVTDFYRCTNCGYDVKQYVNGSIKYLKLDEEETKWLKRNNPSEV
jgi:ribosomal protein L37AE/L43A